MSNLNGVSRIVFVTLLLGLILVNLTFLLLWFISRMLNKNMGSFVLKSDIDNYNMLKFYNKNTKEIINKFLKWINNRIIKRNYYYWKIKFKIFPRIFLLNFIMILGILITIILKILDYNNIYKF